MTRCPECHVELPSGTEECERCHHRFIEVAPFWFDESSYLDANPDVAAAVTSGALSSGGEHWIRHGQYEGRRLAPDRPRNAIVRSMLDPSGAGIEIGPLDQPLMPKSEGHRVTIVDLADARALREIYAEDRVDISRIEEVDHVLGDRTLTEVLAELGPVDWVVAGHVLEHIPDPLRFLRAVESILSPSGRLVLVLPDKRYCFDHYGELSTAGQIVDAFLEERTLPTPGQIVDYFARTSIAGDSIAWGRNAQVDPVPMYDASMVRSNLESALDGATFDGQIHCWRFTPASFRLLIDELRALSMTGLTILDHHDTVGAEFFVAMGAADDDPTDGDHHRLLIRSKGSHSD